MDPRKARPRPGGWPVGGFALPDAPVAVDLQAVAGDGLVQVAGPAEGWVRVGRVLGLSGPWRAADLQATLDGVSRVLLTIRGRDHRGHLLADVVGIDDADEPTLGAGPQCR